MSDKVVLRFDEVTFEYLHKRPILHEASFSVRQGSKITLMGQNGAGKSTIFKLITGGIKPKEGGVHVDKDATIGTAKQIIDKGDLLLNIRQYFEKAYPDKVPFNAEGEMRKVMEAVNLVMPLDVVVNDLSGGQQARLLLAFALITHPDILLLDEPTNNLDQAGIDHLIEFLIMYDKTVIVISHDANFLNCFTDGVVYLDVFSKKTELYVGDYYAVVEEIESRIERERRQNAQLEKNIRDRKEKVNFFAHKGGKMRKLAKKMKDEIEDDEANKVSVRQEDKTIRDFSIMEQDISGEIVTIHSLPVVINNEVASVPYEYILRKKTHLLIKGPNGTGKSTFLRDMVSGHSKYAKIKEEVRVGYYSQDFQALNYEQNVFDSLEEVRYGNMEEHEMRSVAAGFLITGELMGRKISELSEGQKGLLSFARLVLMQPGLIVLDEPSNHINFRHLPVIGKALSKFEGAVILVSHMQEFVDQIRIDDEIDYNKFLG